MITLANQMTLSKVRLSDKYIVSEICSAQISFTFDDVLKFMQIFNLLNTLVVSIMCNLWITVNSLYSHTFWSIVNFDRMVTIKRYTGKMQKIQFLNSI